MIEGHPSRTMDRDSGIQIRHLDNLAASGYFAV
jgi:hypothetical protein